MRDGKWGGKIKAALAEIGRPATSSEIREKILGPGPHRDWMALSNAIATAGRYGRIGRHRNAKPMRGNCYLYELL